MDNFKGTDGCTKCREYGRGVRKEDVRLIINEPRGVLQRKRRHLQQNYSERTQIFFEMGGAGSKGKFHSKKRVMRVLMTSRPSSLLWSFAACGWRTGQSRSSYSTQESCWYVRIYPIHKGLTCLIY